MLDSITKSMTKDYYGPVFSLNSNGIKVPSWICRFQDSFSVLDWGKMPDVLPHRGISQALIHHHLASALGSKETWKEFLRSPDALAFRKAASSIPQHNESVNLSSKTESIGSMLNEMSEHFPIAQTYLGMISEQTFKALQPHELVQPEPGVQSHYGLFEMVIDEKIPMSSVLGRSVWDYSVWKKGTGTKLLPVEFKCHFELTDDSLSKLNTESLALPKTASMATVKPGTSWDFPLIEMALAQDPFHHRVGYSELMWITGFTPSQIQKTLLTAAWCSSFLRWSVAKAKLNLQEVTLRFAMSATGELILASTQTLDDLRMTLDGHLLHSDSALEYYQKTNWFESVMHAQKNAKQQGVSEWKRLCVEPAPWLEPKFKLGIDKIAPMTLQQLTGINVSQG